MKTLALWYEAVNCVRKIRAVNAFIFFGENVTKIL